MKTIFGKAIKSVLSGSACFGVSGPKGFSGDSGVSAYSSAPGFSGRSGRSGFSGFRFSGFSSSGSGVSGFSGFSACSAPIAGFSGVATNLVYFIVDEQEWTDAYMFVAEDYALEEVEEGEVIWSVGGHWQWRGGGSRRPSLPKGRLSLVAKADGKGRFVLGDDEKDVTSMVNQKGGRIGWFDVGDCDSAEVIIILGKGVIGTPDEPLVVPSSSQFVKKEDGWTIKGYVDTDIVFGEQHKHPVEQQARLEHDATFSALAAAEWSTRCDYAPSIPAYCSCQACFVAKKWKDHFNKVKSELVA